MGFGSCLIFNSERVAFSFVVVCCFSRFYFAIPLHFGFFFQFCYLGEW